MFDHTPADEFGLAVFPLPAVFLVRRKFMTMRKLVSLILMLLAVSRFTFAQGAATGDVHVTVKDPKGSLVTNATVTARDQAKGLERSVTGNTQGEYRIQLLPPGNYQITVDAPGFAKATVENVVVTVGQVLDLPVSLTLAGAQEVINVSAASELIETSRTSTTDTIEQKASTTFLSMAATTSTLR